MQLLHPGDAEYDHARSLYNGLIDRRPALIARCSTPDDVKGFMETARERLEHWLADPEAPPAFASALEQVKACLDATAGEDAPRSE